MEKWIVELHVSQRELAVWQAQFPPHGDPYITDFEVPDGDNGTKIIRGVASNQFVDIHEPADVHAKAAILFDGMKGWVIVESGWTNETSETRIGAVYCLGEDGTYRGRHFFNAETGFYRIQGFGAGVIAGGDEKARPDPPMPTNGQQHLSSAEEGTKAALKYMGRAGTDDWNNLYRAFDALGKVEGLRAASIPRKDAVRLAQTFSQHRKHVKTPMDDKELSFHEARLVISTAIRNR